MAYVGDCAMFQVEDVQDRILAVVKAAFECGVIDVEEVFVLGMSQHDQEDWEDGRKVVQEVEARLDALGSGTWGLQRDAFRNTHRPLIDSLVAYEQEEREALEEQAIEASLGVD